jgi:tetratricopeptide (TPR) repeat protein
MPRQKSTHVADPVALGRRLREARERAGLSQRALSFPGCSAAYISRVEAGDRIPSLQLVRELANRLDVSEDYLLTGDTTAQPPPQRLVEAEIALRLDDLEEARRLYEEAAADPKRKAEHAEALTGLGKIALRQAEIPEAIELFERALELSGGDPAEAPGIAENLGRTYAQAGELAPAIALFERCVERYEDDADPVRFIRFACLLGYALTDNGDFGRAEQVLARALNRGRDLSDPYTRARLYWSQSRLLGEQGQSDASARYARMALETLRVTEDTYSLALAHQLLAHAYLDSGRAEEASEVLREARPLIEATATPVDLAHFEIEEARALAACGSSEEAASLAMSAAGRLAEARPVVAGRAYVLLADVYQHLGDSARAKELLELAIDLLEDRPHPRYVIDAYRKLAEVLEDEGRAVEALEVLKRAMAVQARVGRSIA